MKLPDSIKQMLLFLETVLYTTLFLVLISGRLDAQLFELIGTFRLPLELSVVVLTVLLLAFSLLFSTFLNSHRSMLVFALLYLASYKIALLPDGYSPEHAFVVFFAPFLFAFSARGNLTIWIGASLLYIVGVIINLYHLYSLIDGAKVIQSLAVSALSMVAFMASYTRIPLDERGEKVAVVKPTKKNTTGLVTSEGAPRETAVHYAVDDTETGELTSSGELTNSMRSNRLDFQFATQQELESVIFFMARVFGDAQTVAVFVFDSTTNRMVLTNYQSKTKSVQDGAFIEAGQGPVGQVIETRQFYNSRGLALYTKDLHYYKNNEVVKSLLVVPIIASRDNELLGAILVDSALKDAFTDSQRMGLSRFSKITGSLLQNVRMRHLQEQNAARFQLFYDSSRSFAETQSSAEIVRRLLDFLGRPQEVFRVLAVAHFPNTQTLTVMQVYGSSVELAPGYQCPAAGSMILKCLESRQSFYDGHYQRLRYTTPVFTLGEGFMNHTQSLLVIPFGASPVDFEVALVVEGLKADDFDEEMREMMMTLVSNGSSAFERASLYQQMQTLATTDGLTKLTNHRSFQDKLHDAILTSNRYDRPLSLLLMDIDHFKNFNDTYGHQVGDMVLQKIARVLESTVRTSDVPARYGGEEFVVTLPETELEAAVLLADRVRSAISMCEIVTEHEVLHVTVSIGVASMKRHANTQEQLIGAADAAMYVSKKDGRNRVTVYQPWMSEKV